MVLLVTACILVDQLRADEWLTRTDLLAAYIPYPAFSEINFGRLTFLVGVRTNSLELPLLAIHSRVGCISRRCSFSHCYRP